MELIVCLLLASILTAARPVSDLMHLRRGVEPPHLAKARLKAAQQKAKLAAKLAKAERRQVRPGEDKPTLRDVIRVYWGDALADVLEAHNRDRTEKAARRAAPKGQKPAEGIPLWRRVLDLMVRPFGEPASKPEESPANSATGSRETVKSFDWDCRRCDIYRRGYTTRGAAEHDALEHRRSVHGDNNVTERPSPLKGGIDLKSWNCPGCNLTLSAGAVPDDRRCAGCRGKPASARRKFAFTCQPCGFATSPIYDTPDDASAANRSHQCTTNKGETMVSVPEAKYAQDHAVKQRQSGEATGDAHDVESAIAQCDALTNDLTAIDTALDLIDERRGSAGNAAELIHAFLASKNVEDTAVGGMAQAMDMLSPTHMKALMDAVAAAKQGVQNTRDVLAGLQDAEQLLNGADGSVLNGR